MLHELVAAPTGPRHLWDEVEAAYTWWVQAGSPTAEQWRVTVTPQGQRVDLGSTLEEHPNGKSRREVDDLAAYHAAVSGATGWRRRISSSPSHSAPNPA